MRVHTSKSTWELNQDLVPGSEEPVVNSRFPNGKSSPENEEMNSDTDENISEDGECTSETGDKNKKTPLKKDGRVSRLGHYSDTSFILKSLD